MAPFDQIDFPLPQVTLPVTDDVLRVLIEAREWLSDPAHWCKGSYREGNATCVRGAVLKAGGYFVRGRSGFSPIECRALDALDSAAWRTHGSTSMGVNDHEAFTHMDVLAIVDGAIAARRAEIGA